MEKSSNASRANAGSNPGKPSGNTARVKTRGRGRNRDSRDGAQGNIKMSKKLTKEQIEKLSDVKAIRLHIGEPKVSMTEFKALSLDERADLGQQCRDVMIEEVVN